jgi:hypothetical protein
MLIDDKLINIYAAIINSQGNLQAGFLPRAECPPALTIMNCEQRSTCESIPAEWRRAWISTASPHQLSPVLPMVQRERNSWQWVGSGQTKRGSIWTSTLVIRNLECGKRTILISILSHMSILNTCRHKAHTGLYSINPNLMLCHQIVILLIIHVSVVNHNLTFLIIQAYVLSAKLHVPSHTDLCSVNKDFVVLVI